MPHIVTDVTSCQDVIVFCTDVEEKQEQEQGKAYEQDIMPGHVIGKLAYVVNAEDH